MKNRAAVKKKTIIGFKCDEGVRRNKGRVGAFEGPDYIRKYLNLEGLYVEDIGDVICDELDFTPAHKCLQAKVYKQLEEGKLPLVIGGGHDMSFSNYAAAAKYIMKYDAKATIAAINIDPHFDLRDFAQGANSGTSFNEIAKFCKKNNLAYHYYCLGVNKSSNSQELFEIASHLNVKYCFDMQIEKASELIKECIATCDYIYLTLDMDVFKSNLAPGVSAQAKVGWQVETVKRLIAEIKASNKIIVADIAELNPKFDKDDRTAKLAAEFVKCILE